jgi:hypothetical protein
MFKVAETAEERYLSTISVYVPEIWLQFNHFPITDDMSRIHLLSLLRR